MEDKKFIVRSFPLAQMKNPKRIEKYLVLEEKDRIAYVTRVSTYFDGYFIKSEHYFTVHEGKGSSRTENSCSISKRKYGKYLKNATEKSLVKWQFEMPKYKNMSVTIYAYEDKFALLGVATLSYDEQYEGSVKPFIWLGKEITNDEKYDDVNMLTKPAFVPDFEWNK